MRAAENNRLVITTLLSPTSRIFSHFPMQHVFDHWFCIVPSDSSTSERELHQTLSQNRSSHNVGSPSLFHESRLFFVSNKYQYHMMHSFPIRVYGFTSTFTRYSSLNFDHRCRAPQFTSLTMITRITIVFSTRTISGRPFQNISSGPY
jgi:hypothetical protein